MEHNQLVMEVPLQDVQLMTRASSWDAPREMPSYMRPISASLTTVLAILLLSTSSPSANSRRMYRTVACQSQISRGRVQSAVGESEGGRRMTSLWALEVQSPHRHGNSDK